MPFNGTSKRIERLWAFVDQFAAGDDATRADFDASHNDINDSVNDAIAYLEGLVSGLVDPRYVGLSATPPTTRADASALQDDDLYISSDAADLGVIYVRSGGAWIRATDYTAPSAFFKTLLGSADAATMRGLLGLGSASQSDASAFATTAQGTKADEAIPAPSGLSKLVTDWSTVLLSNIAGLYRTSIGATDAPNTTDAFVGAFLKRSGTDGAMIAGSPSSGRFFVSTILSSLKGKWFELSRLHLDKVTDLDNQGVGLMAGFFDQDATGAPTGLGSYTGNFLHVGTTSSGVASRMQIAVIPTLSTTFMRSHNGTSWGSWVVLTTRNTVGEEFLGEVVASANAVIDFTGLNHALYESYRIVLQNVVPATDGVDLNMRLSTDGGSSFLSANYQWAGTNNTSSASQSASGAAAWELNVNSVVGNDAGIGVSGEVLLFSPGDAATRTAARWNTALGDTSAAIVNAQASGLCGAAAAAHNAIRFFFSSGNVATGKFSFYGKRKA